MDDANQRPPLSLRPSGAVAGEGPERWRDFLCFPVIYLKVCVHTPILLNAPKQGFGHWNNVDVRQCFPPLGFSPLSRFLHSYTSHFVIFCLLYSYYPCYSDIQHVLPRSGSFFYFFPLFLYFPPYISFSPPPSSCGIWLCSRCAQPELFMALRKNHPAFCEAQSAFKESAWCRCDCAKDVHNIFLSVVGWIVKVKTPPG